MSICLSITDVDLSLTKDVLEILGGVASIAGVGLAFYVGMGGLKAWRAQLRGAAHHELARKALVELYKFRDAVERARSPAMLTGEMELGAEELAGLTGKEKSYLYKCSGYQKRFDAVFAARAPIEATLLESQALWDDKLHELFRPLFKMQHELKVYVEYWLMALDPREDESYREAHREVIKDKPKLIFDDFSERGDEFRQKFNGYVATIEKYLKSKLA